MMLERGIRTVAILRSICPRHKGFGLAKTSVASGQRDPSNGPSLIIPRPLSDVVLTAVFSVRWAVGTWGCDNTPSFNQSRGRGASCPYDHRGGVGREQRPPVPGEWRPPPHQSPRRDPRHVTTSIGHHESYCQRNLHFVKEQ